MQKKILYIYLSHLNFGFNFFSGYLLSGIYFKLQFFTSQLTLNILLLMLYFVTKSWPVTAPGSQGVFGA
jgi:hypothetical protein